MSNRIATIVVLMGLVCGLAGCGDRPGERAATGGLIGAGAGAGISALTGIDPITGVLIGGGIGALTGAATSPRGER
jgi:hypothetical protein